MLNQARPSQALLHDKAESDLVEIRSGGYEVNVIVHGFPGQSVCHGALCWSTIILLRGHGRIALVDAGPMGMRTILKERLASYNVAPADVTDLILTHSHHDHAINWPLFSKSRIIIGQVELDWAVEQPWGETPVAELYVRELRRWPTLHAASDREEVLPSITVHIAPGHTPGSLLYVLKGTEQDVIFTGDVAKNRAELVSGDADTTYDPSLSAASIKMIWDLWRRQSGTIVVPGHDLPMTQENGVPHYIGRRKAAIQAWFGDDLKTMETFQLNVKHKP